MKIKILALVALAAALSACATVPSSPAIPLPTALPIPTTLPIPTLAPAPTLLGPVNAPSPTVAVSPTLSAPTGATAAPPAQPTSPQEGGGSASACSNPFHPVSPTAQWKYRTSTSDNSSSGTYTVTTTSITANSFTEHDVLDGAAVDTQWTCGDQGLVSTAFGNLHMHGINGFQFNTTQATGASIPPADQWTIGKTWTNGYNIEGQVQQNGANLSGTGTVTIQNKIAAQEQVTVPAGTFTAFRVDSIITLNLTPGGSVPIPITLTLDQSSWYARDTGLVKSTLHMNSQTATTELVSYQP